MELPQYTVYVETPRLLFPKVLKVIFMCLVFYVALWINFLFLKKQMPPYVILITIVILVLVVLITTIFNYTKYSNHQYRFFMNRIEYSGDIQNSIMYSQITSMRIKRDPFDIIFKTGTIDLGGFRVDSIPNLNQVFFYIQKMVQMYGKPQTQPPYPQQAYQQQQNQNYYQRPQ